MGDYCVLLKTKVPSSEVDALLRGSVFSDRSLSGSDRGLFYRIGSDWWDAHVRAKIVLFGRANLSDTRWIDILVDLDDADVSVVYLALFQN